MATVVATSNEPLKTTHNTGQVTSKDTIWVLHKGSPVRLCLVPPNTKATNICKEARWFIELELK